MSAFHPLQTFGQARDTLRVGVHAMGFVGDTVEAAKEAFFPGWSHFFGKAARDRGQSDSVRAQFAIMCSPRGTFLIGDPATAVERIVALDRLLGGVSRVTFQMSTAMWDASAMQRSIELLGTQVGPAIRETPGRHDVA
jgi:alkanesulfonate monooxygenase SsuD/methylene tetrahydromethanopterin reductase-like flavin-dependent oxidoreductase (luciferase family)